MFRFALPLVISIFLIPPFLQISPSDISLPNSPLSDSTYLAIMNEFSAKGVPVNYQSNPALYLELHQWLGTPHRRRGQKGIDCSGLVKIIYKEVYGAELRGSSQDIFHQTRLLPKEALQEGDLVFFRTRHPSMIDHVGIYLGGGKFIHTSSSEGVKVSDLNEQYFKQHFVKAGRFQGINARFNSMTENQ